MTYKYPFANAQEALKRAVWSKGIAVPGRDANLVRVDICGQVMLYTAHGDRSRQFGWEVDHIKPVASGGSDHLSNLQPLHWRNNAAKGDSERWTCATGFRAA